MLEKKECTTNGTEREGPEFRATVAISVRRTFCFSSEALDIGAIGRSEHS